MSTMTSFGNALEHMGTASQGALRRVLAAVDTFCSGAADGQAAEHTYRELMRLGATHEEAVAAVLDRHLRAR